MNRFVDQYLPSHLVGYPAVSVPRWRTQIVQSDSGDEQVNQRWAHPLHKYTLPEAVHSHATFEAVHDHWMAMRGPAYTWPWRDPLDFASTALTRADSAPSISSSDQVIGTGDGATTRFQLIKTYSRGAQSYSRTIYLPVVSSVLVGVGGGLPGDWSVSRQGGVVTFTDAPSLGAAITAGFLFDVEVHFESDDMFEGLMKTYAATGHGDLSLIEARSLRDAL